MKRPLFIFYALALAFHAVVLFCLKPPAPKPPKIFNETYVDVTLTTPPPPQPEVQPAVVPPPPTVQPVVQPKPEEKPPPPPSPQPEMPLPEPKPEPPPPPVTPSVVIPSPKPPVEEYVPVTQPTFAKQAEHVYPPEAARRHQQGTVILMLYITGGGTIDKIEIVKSSGFQLLDAAAIREMKLSKFEPAMDGAIPVRSRAQADVTYKLE